MKLVRLIIALVVVVVIGAGLLWYFFPGMRPHVRDAYEKYGGWTPEARRDDPVGFIQYAQEKLARDLEAFQESRKELAAARRKGAAELEKTRGLLGSAVELAERFRLAFRRAELSSDYPVEVAGSAYGREQLLDQVRLILLQKSNYEETTADFERVLKAVNERDVELVARIQTTKATLTRLEAEEELARIRQLTGEADTLLGQVDEVLGNNQEALDALDTPVRTVEELLQADTTTPTTDTAPAEDVLDFLTGP